MAALVRGQIPIEQCSLSTAQSTGEVLKVAQTVGVAQKEKETVSIAFSHIVSMFAFFSEFHCLGDFWVPKPGMFSAVDW